MTLHDIITIIMHAWAAVWTLETALLARKSIRVAFSFSPETDDPRDLLKYSVLSALTGINGYAIIYYIRGLT